MASSEQVTLPEAYHLTPTEHVPNSALPVLVYRSVLPRPYSEASAVEALEKNQWTHGGTFKHFPTHHFHSITHECYAIYKGSTRFLFGKGPLDEDVNGIEVDLQAGDVIVDPAGVAHCNLRSSDDFEYIGVYPKVSRFQTILSRSTYSSCTTIHRSSVHGNPARHTLLSFHSVAP